MKAGSAAYLWFSCLLLLLLFNFPLLEVANKHQSIAGIPVLPFYIFVVWGLSIFVMFKLAKRYFKSKPNDE
jgi:cytosine/uracil/thiamine/allantoin permease